MGAAATATAAATAAAGPGMAGISQYQPVLKRAVTGLDWRSGRYRTIDGHDTDTIG